MKRGFTFVETLIALTVSLILVFAVGRSVIVSLRAEQAAALLQKASLLVGQVSCDAYLGAPASGTQELGDGWQVTSEAVTDGEEEDAVTWEIRNLSPKDRPSLVISLAFRKKT